MQTGGLNTTLAGCAREATVCGSSGVDGRMMGMRSVRDKASYEREEDDDAERRTEVYVRGKEAE